MLQKRPLRGRPRPREGRRSAGQSKGSASGETASVPEERIVSRVIDGDTLVLDDGTKVRLIGVDTPETQNPELPVQRFGAEATEFTRRTVEGLNVRLELEGPKRDAYGRLLAYVFVDGTLLNREIIRRGYGYAETRFTHSRMKHFLAAEREAREQRRGLWDYSLSDGRITNLLERYERLSPEGKAKLEDVWDELLKEHPAAGTGGGRDDGQ